MKWFERMREVFLTRLNDASVSANLILAGVCSEAGKVISIYSQGRK